MKDEDSNRHRGEYLNKIVRKKGIKISNITRDAGYDRSTFYNHCKDPNLPYPILAKYGRAMKYDFTKSESEQDTSEFIDPETYSDLKKDRDEWKHRYIELTKLMVQYLKKHEGHEGL